MNKEVCYSHGIIGVGFTREVGERLSMKGNHVNLRRYWFFVLRTGTTLFLVCSVYVEKESQLSGMPVNHMRCVLIKIGVYPPLCSDTAPWPPDTGIDLPSATKCCLYLCWCSQEFNHVVGLWLWLLFIQSSVSEIPSYCCINTHNSYDALVDPLMGIWNFFLFWRYWESNGWWHCVASL